MRFAWDEAKAARNVAKHHISFHEAATVFGDALSWTFPDPDHSIAERRWLTIGLADTGQILVVAHAEESDATIRIISARRATRNERRAYEEG